MAVNQQVPVTSTIWVISPQTRQMRLVKSVNIRAGCRMPCRVRAVKTGERCPSRASWYKIRGELETAVAQLRRQLETIRRVTMNVAEGPQKGWAAVDRFKNVSLPSPCRPCAIAKRIRTQEPQRYTSGISQAAKVRTRKVSPGRRLSATNEAAVSQP